MRVTLVIALAFAATIAGLVPAAAQGVELYASTHVFALPSATTNRIFGMGGFTACVQDDGFANPAFAGDLDHNFLTLRSSTSNFEGGLQLKGLQSSFGIPLREDGGMQLSLFQLDSDPGMALTGVGPVLAQVSEDDVAIAYGRSVSARALAGIAVVPVFKSTTDLFNPLSGAQLAHIRSDAKYGARLGFLYRLKPGGFIGVMHDAWTEDVTAMGPLFGPGMGVRFDLRQTAVGVSYPLTDEVLAAVEWQEFQVRGAGLTTGDAGMRAGLEARLGDRWAVRMGSNDGGATGGIGWNNRHLSVDLTYLEDWNGDAVGAALGGSNTYQIEVRDRW